MAACCGTTKERDDLEADADDGDGKHQNAPDQKLALQRVHEILDTMSAGLEEGGKKRPRCEEGDEKGQKKIVADDDIDAASRNRLQSGTVNESMQLTARLWSRHARSWPVDVAEAAPSMSFRAPDEGMNASSQKRTSKKKRNLQMEAYVKWRDTSVDDWLVQLGRGEKPPNGEQKKFLSCVVDRCKQEHRSLGVPVPHRGGRKKQTLKDEPLRCCLMGIPGAGKSTCIEYVRRLFEECLGWEDGVQFQFLASQNTMAALIGGQTLHSWGGIPINATQASDKANTKGADGDIDELFQKALGIRWIIIDEISTVSPSLLGLLDSYLRRACLRHPYAYRGKQQRPFGGINLVFAGDFWQLPPVKQISIYANPFTAWTSTEEQRALKMFWTPEDTDGIQKTFVLTEPMRTTDRWLRAVLSVKRDGKESWEIYCFIHGLPTRNVGTWLPGQEEPWCENPKCASLRDGAWSQSFLRGRGQKENWVARANMECEICKSERRRRCCVLWPGEEEQETRLQNPPFDVAPFVHPFRYPSFHATQLRAIAFAKANHQQVFWIAAYDKERAGEGGRGIGTKDITFPERKWKSFGERPSSGTSWAVFGNLESIFARLGGHIGQCWRRLGAYELSLRLSSSSWRHFGAHPCPFGSQLEPSWASFRTLRSFLRIGRRCVRQGAGGRTRRKGHRDGQT